MDTQCVKLIILLYFKSRKYTIGIYLQTPLIVTCKDIYQSLAHSSGVNKWCFETSKCQRLRPGASASCGMHAVFRNIQLLLLIGCVSPAFCGKCLKCTLLPPNGLHIHILRSCSLCLECAQLTHPSDSSNEPRLLQVQRFHHKTERISKPL